MSSEVIRLSDDATTATAAVQYALVATAEGQGGRQRDQLAGLTVPVRLSGTFDDLKYEVDYRAMAGAAAKSQVGEKIKDRLKGLLGR